MPANRMSKFEARLVQQWRQALPSRGTGELAMISSRARRAVPVAALSGCLLFPLFPLFPQGLRMCPGLNGRSKAT